MYLEPTTVMDPKTSCLLFLLTVVLHACTFFFLQNVASCFKNYISPLDGVVLSISQEVLSGEQEASRVALVPRGPPPVKQPVFTHQQQQCSGSRPGRTNSTASYHALHETLDVSVFR